jgi:hypothetical protein
LLKFDDVEVIFIYTSQNVISARYERNFWASIYHISLYAMVLRQRGKSVSASEVSKHKYFYTENFPCFLFIQIVITDPVLLYVIQCLFMSSSGSLCHSLPLYVIQCLFMSFCASLCHPVPLQVIQYLFISFSASLCHPVSLHVMQCLFMSFSAPLCHSVSLYVTQCLFISSSASLCHPVPLYVIQCLFTSFNIIENLWQRLWSG